MAHALRANVQALREVAKRVEVLDKFVSETSTELLDQERKADATQSIIDQVGAPTAPSHCCNT